MRSRLCIGPTSLKGTPGVRNLLGFAIAPQGGELNLAGTVGPIRWVHVGVDWTRLHEVDRNVLRSELARNPFVNAIIADFVAA